MRLYYSDIYLSITEDKKKKTNDELTKHNIFVFNKLIKFISCVLKQ